VKPNLTHLAAYHPYSCQLSRIEQGRVGQGMAGNTVLTRESTFNTVQRQCWVPPTMHEHFGLCTAHNNQ
jgi:hypothetical protein